MIISVGFFLPVERESMASSSPDLLDLWSENARVESDDEDHSESDSVEETKLPLTAIEFEYMSQSSREEPLSSRKLPRSESIGQENKFPNSQIAKKLKFTQDESKPTLYNKSPVYESCTPSEDDRRALEALMKLESKPESLNYNHEKSFKPNEALRTEAIPKTKTRTTKILSNNEADFRGGAHSRDPTAEGNSLFATGSGRKVPISKASLEKAKHELNNETHSESLFATGSGGKVPLSKASLEKARHELSNETHSESLFATGSGGKVPLSKASLEKARHELNNKGTAVDAENTNMAIFGQIEENGTPRIPRLQPKTLFRTPASNPPKLRTKKFVTPFKTGHSQPVGRITTPSTGGSVELKANLVAAFDLSRVGIHRHRFKDIGLPSTSINDLSGIPPWILYQVNAMNAYQVVFDIKTGLPLRLDESEFHLDIVRELLLKTPGVNPDCATIAWVKNHFRWITWKLCSLHRSFPKIPFVRNAFNLENVLYELQYRYEREINRAERPVIRKILENDLPSTKHMILCVVHVLGGDEVILTDGWYSIQAKMDSFLCDQVSNGRLSVGDKIRICGAAMVFNDSGTNPLSCACNILPFVRVEKQPCLHIWKNCTSPARWDSKLGVQNPALFTKRLCNIDAAFGGVVPSICGTVIRKFQLQYGEVIFQKWHFRNEDAEIHEQGIHEAMVQRVKETIIQEMEGSSHPNENEIADAMTRDPRMPGSRHVSRVLRFQIQEPESSSIAEVSMWNPGEDFVDESFSEGCKVRIVYPIVSKVASPEPNVICLRTTKMSKVTLLNRLSVCTRNVTPISRMAQAGLSDTVGFVIQHSDRYVFLYGMEGQDVLALELSPECGITSASFILKQIVLLRDILFQQIDPSTKCIAAKLTRDSSLSKKPISKNGWKHLTPLYTEIASWALKADFESLCESLMQRLSNSNSHTNNSKLASRKKSKEERQRIQKLKQQEWKLRRQSFQTYSTEMPFVAPTIPNDALTQIQLGKQSVFVVLPKSALSNLRMGDVVKFSDGYLHQLTKVRACIPYRSCDNLLEHVDYSQVNPIAASRALSLEILLKEFKPHQAIVGVHFAAIDL